jgi:hypothetical protein
MIIPIRRQSDNPSIFPMSGSRLNELTRLRQQCPMPLLLRKLGLAAHAHRSCRSPFRDDETASWGIFQRDGRWFFKDHGTGESGDEVTLIARLKDWDTKIDFHRILDFYEKTARKEDASALTAVECPQPPSSSSSSSAPPDLSRFSPGSNEQLIRLSLLRSISVEALRMASERGFLVFGFRLNCEVFGPKDQSGRLAEVRRLDGRLFPAFGSMPEHKSDTLKGSVKSWPLGLLESTTAPSIALVEGLPDFLAAFDFLHRENKAATVAPVTMLSASLNIEATALVHFRNKQVRMFPHYDEAGIKAAERWTQQLNGIASSIDYFDFGQFAGVKDLADLNARINTVPPTITLNEEVLP